MPLADVAQAAIRNNDHPLSSSTPPDREMHPNSAVNHADREEATAASGTSTQQHVQFSNVVSSDFKTPPSTPSTRTGPPRSLSYTYSLSKSPSSPRSNLERENGEIVQDVLHEDGDFSFDSSPRNSDFRGALERTQSEHSDKKGKKRESRILEESWNPIRWFHESPKEEKASTGLGDKDEFKEKAAESPSDGEERSKLPSGGLRRAISAPHSPSETSKRAVAKWGRLRSFVHVAHRSPVTPGPSAETSPVVNITDELIAGGLSMLMLRLWFERDEKDHRRIPVLFHRLRIRVSDSLHPLHGHKSVFRIECEYANGAARWVIYRQLRDFLSLHAHYAVSNAYNRNVGKLPEFPRTSLPYFNFLKKERGGQMGQTEFALMQRHALENYLIDLIRSVMFHPAANRLAGFLEVSALSISLARSGGAQYKAGHLWIDASANKAGGFGRKSTTWKERKRSKWCAVRETYLVVLEEPGELTVWDVFLLDSDFKIERPLRYYRQGFNLLHPNTTHNKNAAVKANDKSEVGSEHKVSPWMDSIRGTVSKILHPHQHSSDQTANESAGDDDHSDSASGSSAPSEPSPMLDPSTHVNPLSEHGEHPDEMADGPNWQNDADGKKKRIKDVSKHTFYIKNSQMRWKLFARNERQMQQWITALEKAAGASHYTGSNRFDSFAPIRLNVAAQWLVDGRDYFWNLSRAILLAKESIYIHDWWITPELQLRRPNKDRYRLDKLLESKAKEGVKIYIILYQEVSNRTTPVDSNYTKQRLVSLHPDIMVQRSPSHFQTGTFYWAHHEKLCVIDQAIAFTGGLDLCFGRWDTAQHVLTDDPDREGGRSEIWPGKDYSNPRVCDFHTLNKPGEDMYDRSKVPRMPWHDVGMQVVGQPARDLARHFIQRWNYLLRIKNHSRVMPFLLPPPEFKPGELAQMGLTGTCEMQICRSAGPWSLGTPDKIEHSIQNAHLKAIQLSEHFVYIENQYFITSTVANDVKIENKIGDALVQRIIRAHRDRTPWKCCIIIPLFPGFTFPVDHSDASAVRIILECQNCTIGRGPNSIFSRLRKEGIEPDEYISVFSLRNWGKLRGDVLSTEQVYIHGKVCIVDDRLAIIGSANINERSQRGDRDSEVAAVIRDTDMIDCTMAGRPFKVGRFAHTLRVRLMQEHIGVDVDALDEMNLMTSESAIPEYEQHPWDPDAEQEWGKEGVTMPKERPATDTLFQTTMDGAEQATAVIENVGSHIASKAQGKMGKAPKTAPKAAGYEHLDEECNASTRDGKKVPGFAGTIVPTLEEKTVVDHQPPPSQADDPSVGYYPSDLDTEAKLNSSLEMPTQNGNVKTDDVPPLLRAEGGELLGAPADASQADNQYSRAPSRINDADGEEQATPGARSILRKHLASKFGSKTWTLPVPRPHVDPQGFEDPISDAFWKNVWVACASHNTEIYRKVFHAIPDDLVTTWKQYKEFIVHHERLNKPPKGSTTAEPVARFPSETGSYAAAPSPSKSTSVIPEDEASRDGHSGTPESQTLPLNPSACLSETDIKARKPAKGSEPFEKWERDEMEKLLGEVCGHLVLYSNHFLEDEDVADNFLFNSDRMLPMPIYD